MARTMGKSNRFYSNPVLRDQEWDRERQAPWWLMSIAVAIVAVAFFLGVYAEQPLNVLGWIVGIATIVVYSVLGRVRTRRARIRLRKLHGEPTA
ncbi:MAG: hypothetical protein JO001_11870 [Alphaproteobacteria bacterium]|nr:hypothetical protein [Alphaproteobacteria bacterium]